MIEIEDHDQDARETMMIQIIIDRRLKCSLGYRTSYTHLNLIPAPSLMMIIQIVMMMMVVVFLGYMTQIDAQNPIHDMTYMGFWTHTVDGVMIKMILLTLRCSEYLHIWEERFVLESEKTIHLWTLVCTEYSFPRSGI